MVTGSSGRAIHGIFDAQTLTNVGDTLNVTFTFTTPTTVGTNEDMRFGLFDTSGDAFFANNISSSSGSPEPRLNELAGFSGEFDINTATADMAFRSHDINSVLDTPTGRLLTTTGGFDFLASSADSGFSIAAGTEYVGTINVELLAGGLMEISQSLNGAAVSESLSFQTPVADVAGTSAGINTQTFDFLGFSATSDAFGSSSTPGDADNGIDFSNVTISFTSVPEPGTVGFLTFGLVGLCFRRRR